MVILWKDSKTSNSRRIMEFLFKKYLNRTIELQRDSERDNGPLEKVVNGEGEISFLITEACDEIEAAVLCAREYTRIFIPVWFKAKEKNLRKHCHSKGELFETFQVVIKKGSAR